ncbi:MAG: hypothetical protein KF684_05540 [Phycisphaeraceae bacterium]|nr:hypothetical protein [Phycisphaeraceae bacterium]
MKNFTFAVLAVAAVAATAGTATAANVVANPTLQSGSFSGTTVANARFRTDATNWDIGIGPNSSPPTGWVTKNIANGQGAFTGDWSFVLSHSAGSDTLTLSVSHLSGSLGTHSVTFNNFDTSFNQIQLQSQSDAGGAVSFSSFSFTGLDVANAGSINIDNSGGQGLAYLVSTGVDLVSFDWTIGGSLSWLDQAAGERPVFNIRLQQSDAVAAPVIPTPLAGGLGLAGMGLIVARRRRA